MKFTVFKDGSWVDSTSSYEEENNPDYLCTIEANDSVLENKLLTAVKFLESMDNCEGWHDRANEIADKIKP